jgi:hypothetical protein
MSITTESRTAITLTPPPTLRLRLQPDRSGYTLLDGGWWPRSADPAAELPGLILALDERHGPSNPITRIMLGMADWSSSWPRRLRVEDLSGRRVVRLGWFDNMPAGLLTATYRNGQRTDLLTIPPDSSEQDAQAAMEQAAQVGNRRHTPAGGQVAMIVNALGLAATVAGGAGIALLISYALCRLALDRRRLAAWESAWSLTGPRWTTRR